MKVKVKLTCQWDDGEKVFSPGTEMELERDLAFSLADMGMVEIVPEAAPAGPAKASTATRAAGKGKKGKGSKGAQAGNPNDEGGPDPDESGNAGGGNTGGGNTEDEG